jgi:hypothetical protein
LLVHASERARSDISTSQQQAAFHFLLNAALEVIVEIPSHPEGIGVGRSLGKKETRRRGSRSRSELRRSIHGNNKA